MSHYRREQRKQARPRTGGERSEHTRGQARQAAQGRRTKKSTVDQVSAGAHGHGRTRGRAQAIGRRYDGHSERSEHGHTHARARARAGKRSEQQGQRAERAGTGVHCI